MCKIKLELANQKEPIYISFKEGTLNFSKKGLNFETESGDYISLSIRSKDLLSISIEEDKQ